MAEIHTWDWTRINDDADRFERAWKTGPQPRIEDYLAEAGGVADGLKGPARPSSHRPGSHRVLAGLDETIGSIPRVLLREAEPDELRTPLVRPASPSMPAQDER